MVNENNTQWWDFTLDEILENYNRLLMERILTHTGWLEQKRGKEIGLDISREWQILEGGSKARGDPTTIPIPNYGGSWRSILGNIP